MFDRTMPAVGLCRYGKNEVGYYPGWRKAFKALATKRSRAGWKRELARSTVERLPAPQKPKKPEPTMVTPDMLDRLEFAYEQDGSYPVMHVRTVGKAPEPLGKPSRLGCRETSVWACRKWLGLGRKLELVMVEWVDD